MDTKKFPTIEEPKVKQRYIVTVEGLAPVRLQLVTWAFDEKEALEQVNNPNLMNLRDRPEIDLQRIQRRRISIKDALTSIVKLVKNY